jgi:hypothetical protein
MKEEPWEGGGPPWPEIKIIVAESCKKTPKGKI